MSDGTDTPAHDAVTTAAVPPRGHPLEPTRTPTGGKLGRYVILDQAGSGGMGEVLRAYDPKLQREVALKRVRGDKLDAEARARIVREARAMAKLSDPNVVAVYDVEEDASLEDVVGVILVMEYVDGTDLRQWLKAEHPWAEIVDVFIGSGRGLAAAHAQGLLHRDFKPGNVLISTADPKAEHHVVKVTDFGLAKLADDASVENSDSPSSGASHDDLSDALTQAGVVIGTPRYMAPEQHAGDTLGPGTDQYAFCVALWEALTGAPPFSGPSREAQKREGPPRWPPSRAPAPIGRALRKGLAPDASDRWPSMDALLDALAYEPARRRRGIALALGSVAILGAGGTTVHAWIDARAAQCSGAEGKLAGVWDEARRVGVREAILGTEAVYAEGVWERIEPRLDAYAESWTSMHAEACKATTVRGEQSTEVMDLRMACLQQANGDLAAVTEVLATADAEVVQRAHAAVDALTPLSACADVEGLQADVAPPNTADAPAVARIRSLLSTAKAWREAGRYREAEVALEEALEEQATVDYDPVRADLAFERGRLLNALGKYEAAEEALRDALLLGTQGRQDAVVRRAASLLVFVVGAMQARPREGLRYRELAQGLAHGDVRAQARLHNNVGSALQVQGELAAAETEHRKALELYEEALGPEHMNVAQSRDHLGSALQARGKYKEAEAEFRQAFALFEAALGPRHPNLSRACNNLASALHPQGRYAEAEAESRRALALQVSALGPEHPDVAGSHANIAVSLSAQHKYAEAEAEHRRALSLLESALGPEHPTVAMSHNNLGVTLRAQGKSEAAEAEYRAALAIREKALGPQHFSVAESRNNLGNALFARAEYAEAEAEHRQALGIREQAFDDEHALVATSRTNLARTLLALDRADEALPLAERAWQRRQQDDTPSDYRAESAFLLAQILSETQNASSTRARNLAKQAAAEYERSGEASSQERAAVQRWLETHR